jgi:N utilization substance protein B
MSSRRRAREIVLQLLYEADMNNCREDDAAKQFIRSRLQGRKALTEFAYQLFQGTLERREDIDTHIARLATRWSLPRMAAADRNVLRLGAFEILYGEAPGRVAVNEAVVLAKRYGSKDSTRFVNGILDRLWKESEQPKAIPSTASVEAASPAEATAPAKEDSTTEPPQPTTPDDIA